MGRDFLKFFGTFGVIAVVLNLAIWGGLIYFAFWCLQHFGII